MADAAVERRITRFFCHRCNIEFEDVLQEFLCPYCAGGFIEQLEGEPDSSLHSGDDISDADMSNLDDSDDMNQSGGLPMLNDLAFLMTRTRTTSGIEAAVARATNVITHAIEQVVRTVGGDDPTVANFNSLGAARPETLLEQLVWTIGGGGPPGTHTAGSQFVLGGAPFVLVGAPGDYVFGGEGLDAVVTQLLGQLENAGPPPLSRERIDALPSEAVSSEQAAANQACSVCWDNFTEGETISRLECSHIFHSRCIAPWLQLHATCPICRRSLAPEPPPEPAPPVSGTVPRVLLRRLPRRLAGDSSETSTSSIATSESGGAVWSPPPRSTTSTNSETSMSSADRTSQYNMDIDYD